VDVGVQIEVYHNY